jgi:NADH:ubiquinone oxidoreductase subunit F (NADH-binding)
MPRRSCGFEFYLFSIQVVCSAELEKDIKQRLTFARRMLMEGDPRLLIEGMLIEGMLIEGMLIAGLVVGATQGYIYLRSEYRKAHKIMNMAIDRAQTACCMGPTNFKLASDKANTTSGNSSISKSLAVP